MFLSLTIREFDALTDRLEEAETRQDARFGILLSWINAMNGGNPLKPSTFYDSLLPPTPPQTPLQVSNALRAMFGAPIV